MSTYDLEKFDNGVLKAIAFIGEVIRVVYTYAWPVPSAATAWDES